MESLGDHGTFTTARDTQGTLTHPPHTCNSPDIGATDSPGTQHSSAPAPAETSCDRALPETLDSTEDDKLNRLFRPVFDFRKKHPSNFIFAHVINLQVFTKSYRRTALIILPSAKQNWMVVFPMPSSVSMILIYYAKITQQPVGGSWCIFVRIYHIGAWLPQNIIKMASRQYASRSYLGIPRLLLHVFISTHVWKMISLNQRFLSYLINYSVIVLIQSSLEIWIVTPIRTMS